MLIKGFLIALILFFSLILAVAFYTLGERKLMAGVQHRQGPYKVGFKGLFQPISDGVKLLKKEIIIPSRSSKNIFLIAPIITFCLSYVGWLFIFYSPNVIFLDLSVTMLLFFAITSLEVYGVIFAGWGSNSKYAFLGGLRTTAQMISYELTIGFCILAVALLTQNFSFLAIAQMQEHIYFCFPLMPFVLIFFICMLAETNRAPFDLPEAEAEIVAGYNVEYSGIIFALFFLGEYASMILLSNIFIFFFFGGGYFPFLEEFSFFVFSVKVFPIICLFVLIRAALPRTRYDQLMNLGWETLLPLSFLLFIVELVLVFILFY